MAVLKDFGKLVEKIIFDETVEMIDGQFANINVNIVDDRNLDFWLIFLRLFVFYDGNDELVDV